MFSEIIEFYFSFIFKTFSVYKVNLVITMQVIPEIKTGKQQ